MHRWHLKAAMGICVVALTGLTCLAAPNGPGAAVLDTQSVWHVFETLKPPMVKLDNGMTAITSKYEWVDKETAAPPEGWTAVKFDDESWLRGKATLGSHSPYVSNLYLRGRFEVTDPSAVKDLKVSVAYHGGAIVTINGHEIARGELAKDAKGPNMIADAYPKKVFVLDNGEIVLDFWGYKGPKENVADRVRNITDVAVPAEYLHKGVNVLAIEAVRAPYDQSVYEYWKHQPRDQRELGEKAIPYDLNWNTCEIEDVKLTGGSSGLVSNATRPKEMQVWTNNFLADDFASDMGDRCDPLKEVAIRGPRNGWSSGKVIIGSPKAIDGLKVTWTDLKQGASTIEASAMRARYAVQFSDRADAARSAGYAAGEAAGFVSGGAAGRLRGADLADGEGAGERQGGDVHGAGDDFGQRGADGDAAGEAGGGGVCGARHAGLPHVD